MNAKVIVMSLDTISAPYRNTHKFRPLHSEGLHESVICVSTEKPDNYLFNSELITIRWYWSGKKQTVKCCIWVHIPAIPGYWPAYETSGGGSAKRINRGNGANAWHVSLYLALIAAGINTKLESGDYSNMHCDKYAALACEAIMEYHKSRARRLPYALVYAHV